MRTIAGQYEHDRAGRRPRWPSAGFAELAPIDVTIAASGAANLVTALLVWRWLRRPA